MSAKPMTGSEDRRCSGQAWERGLAFGHHYRCTRNGTVHEDGKWWCRIHAPSLVKQKRDKQQAKYDARWHGQRDKAAYLEKRAELLEELYATVEIHLELIDAANIPLRPIQEQITDIDRRWHKENKDAE